MTINQKKSLVAFYISKFNDWSYATFVYPENVNYILDELREVFK